MGRAIVFFASILMIPSFAAAGEDFRTAEYPDNSADESSLFQLLKRPDGKPGLLVEALDKPGARLEFAAADSILKILNRRPDFSFRHETRVVEVLTRAINPETVPTVILINSSGARPKEFEDAMAQLGYQTVVCTTGKDAFRAAASSDNVGFVVSEPFIVDEDLRWTLTNFDADARTKDIPFFVVTESSSLYLPIRNLWRHGKSGHVSIPMTPEDELHRIIIPRESNALVARLNAMTEFYPMLRLIPRVGNLAGWNEILDRQFARISEYPRRSNPPLAIESVKRQRTSLDWLLRIAKGEFPRFKIRPESETEERLRDLIDDLEVGPLAVEILGYLPSRPTQDALAVTVLGVGDPSQASPTQIAACRSLARNLDRGGLTLRDETVRSLDRLSKEVTDDELHTAFQTLMKSIMATAQ